MKTLDQIGTETGTDKSICYGHGYCPIYSKLFDALRESPVALLEIGVQFGNSIKMWAEYFAHPDTRIVGVDCTRDYVSPDSRVFIHTFDQGNSKSWQEYLYNSNAVFDIVIDDGSHKADDQRVTFDEVWKKVKPGGYFIIEDVYTWWDSHPHFSSRLNGVAWMGELIGDLNKNGKQYHGKPNAGPFSLNFTEQTIESMTFHPGLVILKKKS